MAEGPNVTLGLLKRGYTEEDIRKLWGGNFLRVLKEVEASKVAKANEIKVVAGTK